jgi:hypothetical protein
MNKLDLKESLSIAKERMDYLKKKYPNHLLLGREDEIGMQLFHGSANIYCLETLLKRECEQLNSGMELRWWLP